MASTFLNHKYIYKTIAYMEKVRKGKLIVRYIQKDSLRDSSLQLKWRLNLHFGASFSLGKKLSHSKTDWLLFFSFSHILLDAASFEITWVCVCVCVCVCYPAQSSKVKVGFKVKLSCPCLWETWGKGLRVVPEKNIILDPTRV